ncbi:MAG: metallophosphoesterase [Sphingobacteriaceae bacterium]|jgi:predicted MPP superfamily phosphohydrolase
MTWTRRKFIKAGLLASFGFILLDSFWFEKYFIETNEFCLGNSTDNNYDLKIIQISDLHLQSFNSQLKKLAKNINEQKPDLIFITGDSVDNKKNVFILNQFLGAIDKSIKKFAILGNWEYWGNVDLEELRLTYSENNCELLINNSRQLTFKNKTISITGVDDYVGGNADIDLALKEFKQSDYHIILNHCPEYGDEIAQKLKGKISYDFMLSGHTHGGQVNLFGFVPFTPQGSGDYLKGWYKDKNIYVSKGIGTSIFPVRFMAKAEIAIFKLLT